MQHRIIILSTSVLIAVFLVWAQWDPRSHTATIGDGTIHYQTGGIGSPAVVLEAGLGMGRSSFDPVFDGIAGHTRVFAYDRPGYGGSSATERPRTFEQVAEDLHRLLQTAGVAPPYVLAGHSLGGIYMVYYALKYTDDVAGVVLIDAPHPELYRRLQEMGVSSAMSEETYWTMPATMRREFDEILKAELTGDLGDIPLTVITSGAAARNEYGPMVQATQRELVAMSTRGKHILADDASHLVVEDKPQLVISAILDAVNAARTAPSH